MSANRTRETTPATGTVAALTLNGTVLGHTTFANTLTAPAENVFYTIEEGENYEVGTGTYTSEFIFTRITAFEKKEGGTYTSSPGTFLSLTGGAQIFIGLPAEEIDAKITLIGDHAFTGVQSAPEFIKNAVDKLVASSAGIVDVFVYDTNFDSDNGAWRNKTSHTSWYNEALNTATRGATRKFPAVALIVAETDTVTIYDATKSDVPMWMVFESDSVNMIRGLSGISSIDFKDGNLVAGANTSTLGISFVSFVLDQGDLYRSTLSVGSRYAGTIEERNGGNFFITGPVKLIVDSTVNDVAITTLSGAETDPATQLPYPTIAVATDGGVSVINHDGSLVNVDDVVDITVTSGGSASGYVDFFSDGRIAYVLDSIQGRTRYLRIDDIPSSDFIASATASTKGSSDEFYVRASTGVTESGDLRTLGASTASGDLTNNALGSVEGLTLFDRDTATPANGMVAYTTKDYATGWMRGDIELALSDSLTDRSVTATTVTDNGTAVIADIATGAEQKKITATGGSITAPVTTGGAIYGWEEIAGVMVFRPGTGWVGISEAAGTLTVVDGTTFAMLKYTNGAGPSAVQFSKIEFDEGWLTRVNSNALIDGTSNAVAGLSFDPQTNKLDVATGDGTSTFINLQRIDYIDSTGTQTSDTMVAVSRKDDQLALGTSAETVFQKPQEDL